MIGREELEHELDSKNHTIRMLQKQLVRMKTWPCELNKLLLYDKENLSWSNMPEKRGQEGQRPNAAMQCLCIGLFSLFE